MWAYFMHVFPWRIDWPLICLGVWNECINHGLLNSPICTSHVAYKKGIRTTFSSYAVDMIFIRSESATNKCAENKESRPETSGVISDTDSDMGPLTSGVYVVRSMLVHKCLVRTISYVLQHTMG